MKGGSGAERHVRGVGCEVAHGECAPMRPPPCVQEEARKVLTLKEVEERLAAKFKSPAEGVAELLHDGEGGRERERACVIPCTCPPLVGGAFAAPCLPIARPAPPPATTAAHAACASPLPRCPSALLPRRL